MPPVEALLWGALGALAIHAAPFFPRKIRRHADALGDATMREYLAAGALRVAVGALFAFAYAHDVHDMSTILAINVGAAWPVFIRGANEAAPDLKPPEDRTA